MCTHCISLLLHNQPPLSCRFHSYNAYTITVITITCTCVGWNIIHTCTCIITHYTVHVMVTLAGTCTCGSYYHYTGSLRSLYHSIIIIYNFTVHSCTVYSITLYTVQYTVYLLQCYNYYNHCVECNTSSCYSFHL